MLVAMARAQNDKTLDTYARKRAFNATPEPPPAVPTRSGPLLFVVQEHAARRLHYDFRLEWDGALKSWAIPKGLLIEPGDKHLAVHVEDHPLDYAPFEGVIPPKQYGAGKVIVWDCGIYSPDEGGPLAFQDRSAAEQRMRTDMAKGKISVTLVGTKLKGSYALVRTAKEPNSWLLIKHRDPWPRRSLTDDELAASVLTPNTVQSIGPSPRRVALDALVPNGPRESLPAKLAPMLASDADEPPTRSGWMHEPKLDGYRVLAFVTDDKVTLRSRNGLDISATFPTLAAELAQQPVRPVILDGEIVAFENGRPSFNAMQKRSQLSTEREIAEAEQVMPTVLYAFDILHALGMNLRGAAYEDRRRYLNQCLIPLPHVQLVHAQTDGYALYRASIAAGLEGVVSKKAESLYESGRRSRAWLKVKAVQTAEFVIGGFTTGEGHRRDDFGALLLGYWNGQDELRFAGHVGTGFNDRNLRDIRKQLDALSVTKNPFQTKPELNASTTWVQPALVAEVRYQEWTPAGTLRAPVFLRLRDDLDAKAVRRKEAADTSISDEATDLVSDALRQLATKESSLSMVVGTHRIGLSQLDKILWPAHKKRPPVTKRDLLRYLAAMAPYMLPHLASRPLTLIRMPDGIYGESFFQKHLTQKLPLFVDTVEVYSKSKTENHVYPLCNNLPTLLWLGQLGTLEFHVWHSSVPESHSRKDEFAGSLANLEASALNHPDYIVFDIDPYIYSGKEAAGAEPEFNTKAFTAGKRVAFWLKELLDALSLRSFVKTSGKTGLHIFVPIARTLTFEQARSVCELIGRHLMAQHPDVITMDWGVDKRRGKIFFDHNMNTRGKTLNAAYSPRGVLGAPVSMPVTWDELPEVLPPEFRVDNAPKLMPARGDAWRDLHTTRQSVEAALKMSAG
jgi:bifunctional non-homologous end joining protein LigD